MLEGLYPEINVFIAKTIGCQAKNILTIGNLRQFLISLKTGITM